MESKVPKVTAHTGCMDTIPNTLESAVEGIKLGVDIIEVDARVTKDGKVILMHDDFINTSLGEKIYVRDLTYDELNRYLFQNGINIVQLSQVLDLCKKDLKTLNIDVKDFNGIEFIVKAVTEKEMENYVILSGCDRDNIKILNEHYSNINYLLNAEEGICKEDKDIYKSFILDTCKDAKDARCIGVNLFYMDCTKEFVEYAHEKGLQIHVWTVDEETQMDGLIDILVDSITTNRVDKLIKKVRLRELKYS